MLTCTTSTAVDDVTAVLGVQRHVAQSRTRTTVKSSAMSSSSKQFIPTRDLLVIIGEKRSFSGLNCSFRVLQQHLVSDELADMHALGGLQAYPCVGHVQYGWDSVYWTTLVRCVSPVPTFTIRSQSSRDLPRRDLHNGSVHEFGNKRLSRWSAAATSIRSMSRTIKL